jgi:hypothetical protein
MVGVKYLSVHPVEVYKLPSGLTLYSSALLCANGHQGVLGGPQPAFEAASESMKLIQQQSYLSGMVNACTTWVKAWWKKASTPSINLLCSTWFTNSKLELCFK